MTVTASTANSVSDTLTWAMTLLFLLPVVGVAASWLTPPMSSALRKALETPSPGTPDSARTEHERGPGLVTTFSTASRAHLRHAMRRAGSPIAGRKREVIEPECVTETGATTRPSAGKGGATVRLRAAAMPRPFRAEALRARRPPPVGRPASAGRRYPPLR